MRKYRKLVSILCATALLISALPAAAADQPNEPHYDDEVQEQAILAYNVLLDYFGRDNAGFPDYPDDFGGAYYNGERLVVLTTAPLSEKQGFYEGLLAPYSVEIKSCEFSYNELNENGRAVAESLDVPLVQYGVNESNNCFKIVVEGEENLDKLQSRAMPLSANAIPIEFEAGEPIKATASLIGGGKLIYKESILSKKHFSIGLCGTWKGRPAVLTCGHSFHSMGTNIKHAAIYDEANNKIGTLESFSIGTDYGVQTAGDWAIILLEDKASDMMTNKVYTNFSGSTCDITQKAMAVPEGTQVWGSGIYNRNYRGIVSGVNTEVTMTLKDTGTKVPLDGMTTFTLLAGDTVEDGDSGGSIYFISNNKNTFYGTLSCGDGPFAVCSPYYWATNFAPKID